MRRFLCAACSWGRLGLLSSRGCRTVGCWRLHLSRPQNRCRREVSDEAFWKMVVDMSEPDGSFQFENFLSNELGYQYVIPRLLQITKPGGVYMGVAPEQNFTYIAAMKPKMAFIVDIRRQNMIELLMYKSLFEMSETRADFLSKLFARKRPEGLSEKSTAAELFDAYSAGPSGPGSRAAEP